ncbi:MAG: response regulator transcription factor, partial [Dermatophilaceae bacterium]
MDVRMPRRSGIEACFAIKELVPSTKIVMLTISDEESDLYDAVRAGANGYLLKDVPGEEIADGLRAVQAGQSLISPSMASKLLSEFCPHDQEARGKADHPGPSADRARARGAQAGGARHGQQEALLTGSVAIAGVDKRPNAGTVGPFG